MEISSTKGKETFSLVAREKKEKSPKKDQNSLLKQFFTTKIKKKFFRSL